MHASQCKRSVLSWVAAAALLSGCATGGALPPVGTPPPDPLALSAAPRGPGLAERAQFAFESMLMGAAIGSSFGPIGMAAGAGSLLIYGAIAGEVPAGFYGAGARPGSRATDPAAEAAREEEIERNLNLELARGDAVEDEIEMELQRQDELMRQIEQQEALRNSAAAAIGSPISDAGLAERADPRSAPTAPRDRELPIAIFEQERTTIPKKSWENNKKLVVVKRTLDADRDGKPEQIRYFDEDSGVMLRKEQDRDYDGRADAWHVYEGGQLVSRRLDNNSDGRVDVWEAYANGRMTSREVDRDGDTVRDALYVYEGTELISEQHDADNDGRPDLLVTYRNRFRVLTAEDTDRNGTLDAWTSWAVLDDEEIMVRIERDTDDDGTRDLFETYERKTGRPVLARREEDKDGDGSIDITSNYKNGRLKSREISDPSLVPL